MKTLYEEMVGHIAYMMRDNHMGIELNWNGIRKGKLKRDESKIKIEIKNEHKFFKKEFDLVENSKVLELSGANKEIVEKNLKEMLGL